MGGREEEEKGDKREETEILEERVSVISARVMDMLSLLH